MNDRPSETTDRYADKEVAETVQWKRDFVSLATAIEEFRKKRPNVHPKLEKCLKRSHSYLWSEVMNTMGPTERQHREVNVLWHKFPDSLIIKIGDDYSLIVSDEEAEDLRHRLQELQP